MAGDDDKDRNRAVAGPRPPRTSVGSQEARQAPASEPGNRAPGARGSDETPPQPAVLLPTLELPKGGGAIRGIDQRFSINPATGTGSLSVGVATSPARGGFQLGLALGYDSGSGNGPWGIGWKLSAPAVTRKTDKGLPRYVDTDDSDLFVLAGAEDLVPARLGNGPDAPLEETARGGFLVRRYRPRTETSFARIERWTEQRSGDIHWQVTTRDNLLNVYGRTPGARIVDPDHPDRVFSWLLEETRDDRGNAARYAYKQEDGAGVDVTLASESNRFETARDGARTFRAGAQRYLKRIQYGSRAPVPRDAPLSEAPDAWLFEVVYDYGEHDAQEPTPDEVVPWPVRPDPFSDYHATFEVRTYRLCRRILMFHRFPELGPAPTLVSSTDFEYEEGPVVTYLRRVTQRGYLRDPATGVLGRAEQPTLELDYIRPVVHDQAVRLDRDSLAGVEGGVGGRSAQWVDLDGEGIPGVLVSTDRAWYYKSNLGGGHLDPPVPLRRLPGVAELTTATAQLTDLDRDGNLDFVVYRPPLSGFMERTPDRSFAPFVALRDLPNIDWDDPNLRFIDLDGDGLPDLLITANDAFVWYRSLGKDGFESGGVIPHAKDELRGPAVVFADATESIQLADMSGDGLVDIVRVRNGEVCYWPNLGYGRFGRKVTLDRSPRFDTNDLFDPGRVRFADLDGSGTSDIVYLGRDGVRLYFNQSGNAVSEPTRLASLPPIDSLASFSVVDLLGTGTATLIWSPTILSERRRRVVYVDLMGGQKPHLLDSVINNLGAEVHLGYAPSTKFYLEDKAAGTPWITRLPFPVQVVERVERVDSIANTRLVSTYSYHHGFYDGVEREFRGFARVEQRDAETFTLGADTELFQAPVRSVSWFHTGAWLEKERIELALQKEYFQGGPPQMLVADTLLPPGLSTKDEREATRALRGRLLRQEVYAEDGSDQQAIPFTVTEQNFEVRLIQSSTASPHAVFLVHPRETVHLASERDPDDPRVMHELVLDVDEFGDVTRQASISYLRGRPEQPEQARSWVTVTEAKLANITDQVDAYRIGVRYELEGFEVTGLEVPPAGTALVSLLALRQALDSLDPTQDLPYEAQPTSGLQRRSLGHQQQLFYANDLSGPLPLGQIQSLALPFESYQLALTTGQVSALVAESRALTGTAFDPSLLVSEGRYIQRDGGYWKRSGRIVFDPTRFYLPIEGIDPFEQHFFASYDVHAQLIETTTDALGNTARAINDYRVLAPSELTDANLNRVAVAFDALGMVTRTAVMGKVGAGEGDTLDDPTIRIEYDVLRWQQQRKPAVAHSLWREQHGPENKRFQESYAYSDGAGRIVMQKVQAEPGDAPARDANGNLRRNPDGSLVQAPTDARWVGTGRTAFNNKGSPVKQYEPFFSSTFEFEDETDLVQFGVTSIIHYDPLGRVIRTEFPDGSESRVELDSWRTTTFDRNDAIVGTAWLAKRQAPGASPDDQRAAQLTLQHAGTPTVVHLDAAGRTFLTVAHNRIDGVDAFYETRVDIDIEGNPLATIDARGVRTIQQRFDVLGGRLNLVSADAGTHLTVADAARKRLRSWDSRGQISRPRYDELQRPTHLFISPAGGGAERLVARTVYGEALDEATARQLNLRNRAFRLYDSAGVTTNERFDFKGNLLDGRRRLAIDYHQDPDWSATGELTDPAAIDAAASSLLESEEFSVRTTYDALNRVTTRTTPDGSITRPVYNQASALEALFVSVRGAAEQPVIANLDYNARRQRILCEHANGVRIAYDYDPETFRLVHLHTTRSSDGLSLQDFRYTSDPQGNIVAIRDDADTTPIFSGTRPVSGDGLYEYDPLYRLTRSEGREHPSQQPSEADAPVGPVPHPNDLQALLRYSERYDYDPAGNIERIVHLANGGGWTRGYQYAGDSNRLLSTSLPGDAQGTFGATYAYDPHGSMVRMPHLATIEWDFADRLRHADKTGGGDVFFTYDAGGERVRKVFEHSGLVEERIYFGGWEIYRRRAARAGAEPDLVRETLHLMDDQRRVAMVETKTVDTKDGATGTPRFRYQLDNHLLSALIEIDEQAQVISYEEYHPYGSTAFHTARGGAEVSAKRYRYTGKERDEETGLDYHGARYYAAWLGRWTSADPIGAAGSDDVYAYASNNPIGRSDPSGLFDISWRQVALGALVAAATVVAVAAVVATAGAAAPGIVAGVAAIAGVSEATVVTAATVTATVVGVAGTTRTLGEAYTGREAFSGRALSDDERSYRIGSGAVGAVASVFGVGALRGGGGGGGPTAAATNEFALAGGPSGFSFGFGSGGSLALPQVATAAPLLTAGLGGAGVLMMSGLNPGAGGGSSGGGGGGRGSGPSDETPPPEGSTPAEKEVKLLPPHDPNQILNLGSGRNPMPGAVNVDPLPHPTVDVVASAENLPFGNEYFKEVAAINPHNPTLPPGEFFNPLEGDVPRVLQSGGRVTVVGQRSNFAIRQLLGMSDEQLAALGFRRLPSPPAVEPRFLFGSPETVSGNSIFLGVTPTGRSVGLQLSFEKIE